MNIEGSVALVTGANRGIGRAYVESLIARGAAKVYATARNPGALDAVVAAHGGKVVPLALDVTDDASVAAAAQAAPDVSLLINNAGVMWTSGFVGADSLDVARKEMETNYFGPMRMVRAFAPALARNGGGTVVNVLSIVSKVAMPLIGSYSASKAAAWSQTQVVRAELASQGTPVIGVFPGPVDTDMAKAIDFDKVPPSHIADVTLDAVEAGEEDVFPDPMSQSLNAKLGEDVKAVERLLAG